MNSLDGSGILEKTVSDGFFGVCGPLLSGTECIVSSLSNITVWWSFLVVETIVGAMIRRSLDRRCRICASRLS